MIYFIGHPRLESGLYQLSTVDEFLRWVSGKTEVQVDTENPYDKKNKDFQPNPYNTALLCIQIGNKEDQWIFENNFNAVKPILEDETVCKIFTNAFHDLRYLYHLGFNVKNIYDCFLAELSLTLGKELEEGYRGLGAMVKRYCGVTLNKDIRDNIQELDDTVIVYAAGDVQWMSDIKQKQQDQIEEANLQMEVRLNNRFIATLARISYKGFKIDVERWLANCRNNQALMVEEARKLNDYVVGLGYEEFLEKQTDIEGLRCNINWNSSQQVVKLFLKLGINCKKRDRKTGTIKNSVEAPHLIRQKNKFEILPTYLKYKELKKEVSTYGEKFISKHVEVTGRIHADFFPLVSTGRISVARPNTQNIPAKDNEGNPSELRKCFIPEQGNVLVIADYKAQEPRITADYSQDPFLIDFIINGDGDSHSLTATAISSFLLGEHITVSKHNNPLVPKYNQKIRDIGKTLNLGLDYGKTSFSVKDDLEITQDEAQTLIDLLKAHTPVKQQYFDTQTEFIRKNGYILIDKVTNRRSYFHEWDEFLKLERIAFGKKTKLQVSRYYKLRGAMERMAANYPIQGTGGSMSKIAAIYFEDEMIRLGIEAWIVNLVHDEIVVECSKEYGETVLSILEDCMIRAGDLFCQTIPMAIDGFIGLTWASKE